MLKTQAQLMDMFHNDGKEMTEADVLNLTQSIRVGAMHKMTSEGIPTGKDLYKLMKLMEDTDNSALQKLKIDTDSDNANKDRQAAMMLSEVLGQMGTFKPEEKDITPGSSVQPKTVADHELPSIEVKPGEDSIGVASLTYDDFTKPTE